MTDRSRAHTRQLQSALRVLGVEWTPDVMPNDEMAALMFAHTLLGAAEAHLLSADLDAHQASLDTEQARDAFGPIRDEVVGQALPIDPSNLLLAHRSGFLLGDLTRAAGPDEESPDVPALAAARDAVAVASALIGYHQATSGPQTDDVLAREHLTVATGLLRQLADRLMKIAGLTADDGP